MVTKKKLKKEIEELKEELYKLSVNNVESYINIVKVLENQKKEYVSLIESLTNEVRYSIKNKAVITGVQILDEYLNGPAKVDEKK